jgi:hypothetical protein
LRFKILAIVPTVFPITAMIAANGLASGQGFKIVSLTLVSILASIQIGYALGLSFRAGPHTAEVVAWAAGRIFNT